MSTPIEVIRNGNELPAPLDTRGGGIDPTASLDYNDLLRKASEQAPEQELDSRPPQQVQQHIPQQMSQPAPHQFNPPVMEPLHINMPPQNYYYDSYPIQNSQQTQPKIQKKEKPNKFDEIQKEFIIVLISSLFINSSVVQSFLLKNISIMFSEGNITTAGILINAILIGLIVVGLKNIQFSINS